MGPKKKGKGGKKSGKKSAAGGKRPDVLKVDETLTELSKEFFLIQIRDLEYKISRYQTKCDTLELRNKEVEEKFEKQAEDKKEIVSFLKKQLENKTETVLQLQEEVKNLKEQNVVEKIHYENESTTEKSIMQEMKDRLTSENMILSGKLTALEEFRVQKDELLQKFSDMEESRKQKDIKHNEKIYLLERKAVVDKDRLKKEMIVRVNTVAAEFRKVSNKQIADTTKRTIRENVVINLQLEKMSDKTVELINENEEMNERAKKQNEQMHIVEFTEKELIKKNASNQKVIRMLTQKLKEQSTALEQLSEKEGEVSELRKCLEKLTTEYEHKANECGSMSLQTQTLSEDIKQLTERLTSLSQAKEYLLGVLSDAVGAIKLALEHTGRNDPAELEHRNNNLLQKVIGILNLAVENGSGFHPDELTGDRRPKRPSYALPPATKNRKSPLLLRAPYSHPNTFTHYKRGDMGFVPPIDNNASGQDSITSKNSIAAKNILAQEQLAKGTLAQSTYTLIEGMAKLPPLHSL